MSEKERRLWDEYENYCKYYCQYKDELITKECEVNCPECDNYLSSHLISVTPCNYCPTIEYIRHIRDVI